MLIPDIEFTEYFDDHNEPKHNVGQYEVVDAIFLKTRTASISMSTPLKIRTSKPKNGTRDIWKKATTLTPGDLADTKVHVTLRLDPHIYRDILKARTDAGDKSVTATIERLLRNQLSRGHDVSNFEVEILSAVKNLLVHSSLQDVVLSQVVMSGSDKAVQKKLSRAREVLQRDLSRVAKLIPSG